MKKEEQEEIIMWAHGEIDVGGDRMRLVDVVSVGWEGELGDIEDHVDGDVEFQYGQRQNVLYKQSLQKWWTCSYLWDN